jgi:quercetin dioxygenase-like cupin family protein
MILRAISGQAEFNDAKMGKVSLAAGAHLLAGLNCLLPGQEHRPHVHPDQDKIYLVLDGSGEASVGEETSAVAEGDLVFAPAGVPHGLKNTSSSLLVALVVFAPPPTATATPSHGSK